MDPRRVGDVPRAWMSATARLPEHCPDCRPGGADRPQPARRAGLDAARPWTDRPARI